MNVPISGAASIALSGLQAARLQLHTAAHNLANLGTADFQRQQVTLQARAGGGVEAAVGPAADGDPAGAMGDLIGDLVALKFAEYAFRANVLSLQASDRMLGRLLDTRA